MLRLESLRKSFGDTVAVDGLSLHVRRGEIFGLLGPNGAGKTTTIGMITGLLEPDDGRVTVGDGASPRDHAVRRRIGVAPQALALYDELTGRENLRFFGRLYGLRGPALADRCRAMLDFTGLADRGGDRVGAYSGGMKRRLNLAVSLLHEPEVLLLDEPTAGVDPQSRNAIFRNVEALRERGCTVVYTTHYMEEAQRLCDRVAIIDHGRVLALDPVDDLIAAHGGHSVVTVRRDDTEQRTRTDDPVAVLTAELARGDLQSLHVERPDLETVFLELTGRRLRD
ncbi:MAG: ABC transporter ATP-binding protein [Planctomycetota bacterium]|jgi:ABC-2 type transport system ATP-binding protein